MRFFEKPIVVISKCLGFEACRYNGDIIQHTIVDQLTPFFQVITVCPEVEIGLGTPRQPIRLVKQDHHEIRLIQPATSLDLTEKMNEFSNAFFRSLGEVDGFILKGRSPSCAIKDAKVYAATEQAPVTNKSGGLFGALVFQQFGHLAVEDEGRLNNDDIRRHFLTKLFLLTEFRMIKHSKFIRNLVDFQSKNKYLFMAFDQVKQKELGRIVANVEKRTTADTFQLYEQKLFELTAKPASRQSFINVLFHIMGYFSKQLSSKEKAFFLSIIEKYKHHQISLSNPLTVLRAWSIRFNQEYLQEQTIFEPFPEALEEKKG